MSGPPDALHAPAGRRAVRQTIQERTDGGLRPAGSTPVSPASSPRSCVSPGAAAAAPPGDPVALSYAIAASLVLDGHEKQRLLEHEDAALRLEAESDLLARENRILDVLPMIPAGQFLDGSFTPN
ncbi:hypothetical protein GCM10023178_48810 [Actinomadura luteofluorescens]